MKGLGETPGLARALKSESPSRESRVETFLDSPNF